MRSILNNKGVSLVGLMVTIILVASLSTLVFLWIDPLAQSGATKDVQRLKSVNILSAAIKDYSNEHKGALPFLGSVTTSSKKVLCTTQSGDDVTCGASVEPCLRIADMDFYNNNLFYLPIDPDKTSEQDTGYYVQKATSTDQLIVGACNTYGDAINKKSGLKVSCDAYAGGYCWKISDTAFQDCDTICADNNLICSTGVIYESDIDDVATGFCALNKSWGDETRCASGCVDGDIVGNYDGASTCFYNTGYIDCGERVSSYLNICPCE